MPLWKGVLISHLAEPTQLGHSRFLTIGKIGLGLSCVTLQQALRLARISSAGLSGGGRNRRFGRSGSSPPARSAACFRERRECCQRNANHEQQRHRTGRERAWFCGEHAGHTKPEATDRYVTPSRVGTSALPYRRVVLGRAPFPAVAVQHRRDRPDPVKAGDRWHSGSFGKAAKTLLHGRQLRSATSACSNRCSNPE